MKNKIIAAILLMGILWNGQMVYAEDTAVGEVIAMESENSESTNAETTEMELERKSESQGVVSTESAVTVISEAEQSFMRKIRMFGSVLPVSQRL